MQWVHDVTIFADLSKRIMTMRRSTKFLYLIVSFAILVVFFLPAPAFCGPVGDNHWEYHLAPYAWLAGQTGNVATLPGLPPAEIDVDFWDDVLGNINGALFLVGEARKGRFGALFDLAYVDIEDENATVGSLFSSVSSRTKSWIVSAAGFFRLAEGSDAWLDLVAGIRYWSVDSSLRLGAGLLPAMEVSNQEDWVDPLVGVKGMTSLGHSRFFLSGGGAIGGFGAASDLMWDANVNLGYRWTETFSTTLGYRYLDVDYEKEDFLYDISQDGPLLGLSWRF
jgi:hypothetical protein